MRSASGTARRFEWNGSQAMRAFLCVRDIISCPAETIDLLDHQKYGKRHNQKIYSGIEKQSDLQSMSKNYNLNTAKVNVADEQSQKWIDNIVDQRSDHLIKRRSKNHADGEVNRATFDRKFLKLFPHTQYINFDNGFLVRFCRQINHYYQY